MTDSAQSAEQTEGKLPGFDLENAIEELVSGESDDLLSEFIPQVCDNPGGLPKQIEISKDAEQLCSGEELHLITDIPKDWLGMFANNLSSNIVNQKILLIHTNLYKFLLNIIIHVCVDLCEISNMLFAMSINDHLQTRIEESCFLGLSQKQLQILSFSNISKYFYLNVESFCFIELYLPQTAIKKIFEDVFTYSEKVCIINKVIDICKSWIINVICPVIPKNKIIYNKSAKIIFLPHDDPTSERAHAHMTSKNFVPAFFEGRRLSPWKFCSKLEFSFFVKRWLSLHIFTKNYKFETYEDEINSGKDSIMTTNNMLVLSFIEYTKNNSSIDFIYNKTKFISSKNESVNFELFYIYLQNSPYDLDEFLESSYPRSICACCAVGGFPRNFKECICGRKFVSCSLVSRFSSPLALQVVEGIKKIDCNRFPRHFLWKHQWSTVVQNLLYGDVKKKGSRGRPPLVNHDSQLLDCDGTVVADLNAIYKIKSISQAMDYDIHIIFILSVIVRKTHKLLDSKNNFVVSQFLKREHEEWIDSTYHSIGNSKVQTDTKRYVSTLLSFISSIIDIDYSNLDPASKQPDFYTNIGSCFPPFILVSSDSDLVDVSNSSLFSIDLTILGFKKTYLKEEISYIISQAFANAQLPFHIDVINYVSEAFEKKMNCPNTLFAVAWCVFVIMSPFTTTSFQNTLDDNGIIESQKYKRKFFEIFSDSVITSEIDDSIKNIFF